MGQAQEAAVRSFLDAVDEWSNAEKIASLVSDDVVYQVQVPSVAVHGRAAFQAEVERQMSMSSDVSSEIVAMASDNRHVFTERVDQFKMGETPTTFRVAAVFEVAPDGLVSGWREYWDSFDLARQLGIQPNDLLALFEQRSD